MSGTIDGGIGIRDFHASLAAFGDDVQGKATAVFQEAGIVTAEAIVIGNEFGPGVPVDTGFLRASFRIGIGQPVDGPSDPPSHAGRTPGSGEVFPAEIDTRAAATATLGDWIYITTNVGYAEYLEDGGRIRRFGPYPGNDTPFIAPVEHRFAQIVEDAAKRVGYGEP